MRMSDWSSDVCSADLHDGVNLRSTLRALARNVDEGATVQGGSTITQQLVKVELVGDEQTIDRKAREAVLARRLETTMSKAEIQIGRASRRERVCQYV